jgi:hypothetical protein
MSCISRLLGVCALISLAAYLPGPQASAATFGEDLAFLRQHTKVIVLSDDAGRAQVAVAPRYQGRVLTSTSGGLEGASYGWINREVISDGRRRPHMNVFGGEDRFWLGPEGGQYSVFFPKGAAFTLEHWQTPEPMDWGAWQIVSQSKTEISFRRPMKLVNYSGTPFQLTVDRVVRLIPREKLADRLGVAVGPEASVVAYESENRITNTGTEAWQKDTGLLSIWILSMFQPSDQTTIVIPFKPGPEDALGKIVNDAYFGKVPADRLKIGDARLFFRGDGKGRGKIGVGPRRVKPVLGSYAADSKVLTLVQFTLPPKATDYVNSMWEIQEKPYDGDAANSYNDGPPAPGVKPLGPFYELESSSPAAALGPGDSLTHVHRTVHLQGPEKDLNDVAEGTLGVGLKAIREAFGGGE